VRSAAELVERRAGTEGRANNERLVVNGLTALQVSVRRALSAQGVATGAAIVILNNDSVGHPTTVPAYQLSIVDGFHLTDRLTGTQYTVRNGSVTIPATALLGHYGVVLVSDDAH
jgi:hypothetical protein